MNRGNDQTNNKKCMLDKGYESHCVTSQSKMLEERHQPPVDPRITLETKVTEQCPQAVCTSLCGTAHYDTSESIGVLSVITSCANWLSNHGLDIHIITTKCPDEENVIGEM